MWLHKAVVRLEKVVYSLNEIAHKISLVLLFLLMLLTFCDVMGRYFFRPIQGTFELTGYGLALIVFLSLSYTQSKKGNIAIGLIVDKWPKKLQSVADLITYLIIFFLLSLTSWQLLVYAKRSFMANAVTGDLKIPIYYFVIIVACGTILLTLTILVDFLKSMLRLVEKNES